MNHSRSTRACRGAFQRQRSFESLENRPLLAPVMLADVNTNRADSSPADFVRLNNLLLFAATGRSGRELYKLDLSSRSFPVTATLVADFVPGEGSSSPMHLVRAGNDVYFTAHTPEYGREVWRTNGTAEGTFLMTDIRPGPDSSLAEATKLGVANNNVLFAANDGRNGMELWIGDSLGFHAIDIRSGPAGSYPGEFSPHQGCLFFTANDGEHGVELWRSCGSANTQMIADAVPGPGSLRVDRFFPGEVSPFHTPFFFFAADDGQHGVELWTSDGIPGFRTEMVADLNPGPAGSNPAWGTAVRSTAMFYFSANAPDRESGAIIGHELWRTSATDETTRLVADIVPGAASSNPAYLTNANGYVFFVAQNTRAPGRWLHAALGLEVSEVGGIPSPVGTIFPFYEREIAVSARPVGQTGTGVNEPELWFLRAAPGETPLFEELNPGSRGSFPNRFTEVEGAVVFTAKTANNGFEPWLLAYRAVPGDADGDLDVDLNDLNIVKNNFGASGGGPGDVNGDEIVDLNDLNLVRRYFGTVSRAPDQELSAGQIADPAPHGGKTRLSATGMELRAQAIDELMYTLGGTDVGLTRPTRFGTRAKRNR